MLPKGLHRLRAAPITGSPSPAAMIFYPSGTRAAVPAGAQSSAPRLHRRTGDVRSRSKTGAGAIAGVAAGICRKTALPGDRQQGRAGTGEPMQAPDTSQTAPPRRDDAGTFKITDRDITGLELCAEQHGAPYDLLAAALEVTVDRLRSVAARWRHRRLRHHQKPGTRPGLVLAHPRRDAAAWPALPRPRTLRHPAGPHPRRPRHPPLARAGRGLPGREGVVAQRTPHPRRRRRQPGPATNGVEVHWPSLATVPPAGRAGPSRPS